MKKFRFLYIAAAALLFAACANEEDGIGNNGPVAATVKADIANNIKPVELQTTTAGQQATLSVCMSHLQAIQQETTKSM